MMHSTTNRLLPVLAVLLALGAPGLSGCDADPLAGDDGGSPPLADGGLPPTDSGSPGSDAGTPGTDSGAPGADSGAPPTDGGVPGSDGGTPDTDAGVITPPSSFRGIPERPYADVVLPAVGTVEQGATSCIGTPEEPAFMIGDGVEFTTSDGKYQLTARYCIISNINFRGRFQLRNSMMVEVRDSEVHHASGAGISIGGTDVAIIDSHVHHSQGNNGHGVLANCGSQRIWVGGNLLEYNDEDGFQSGHNCTEMRPDELYFFGNTCNNNRENCFDLKWTNRAVMSGNVSRRHRVARDGEDFTYDDGSSDGTVNSGSDGMAVVIGSDGTPTTTFLFDNLYEDNMGCVRVEDAVDVWALGEDCRDALPDARAGGFQFDKSGHTRLVGSTFSNVPFMITDNWRRNPVIEEADNTRLDGTEFRQGENAMLTSGGVSESDVTAAYMTAFGRTP